MVDTIRTLTDMLALLADNITGDIAPQDVRDLFISSVNQYGQIWEHMNAAETDIDTVDTWTEIVLTSPTLDNVSSLQGSADFDEPADGRLRYLGTPTRKFHITASISITAVGNNKSTQIALGISGTPNLASVAHRFIAVGADEGNIGIQLIVSLATNQYVSAFVKNTTDNTNLTIVHMNIQAVGMIE